MGSHWWQFLLGGSLTGVFGAFLLNRVVLKRLLAQAQSQAEEWLQSAEEKVRADELERKNFWEEETQETLKNLETELRPRVKKSADEDERIKEKELDLQEKIQVLEEKKNRQEQIFKSRQGRVLSREGQIRSLFEKAKSQLHDLQSRLGEKSSAQMELVKGDILKQLEETTRVEAVKKGLALEEDFMVNLEREAKRILMIALSRFARPYCSERGIGNVEFVSADIKERTLGPERVHLRTLEKACGIDISINEEYQSASVLGYDPVRRELGRMTLEKMQHEKNLNEERIQGLMQNCKKELFRKIINDGNRIAKELKVEGLSEEIRHMMGALRYRYSFAQNQHFHCAEVGFLCGLLSAELGVEIKDGRRSGLLHDIGKAMDHSREGGHAVIGADFIEKNGEKPHIVHAVRAHHFDEPPATDLAYLVIAADAISGARPGARRSTMDSYTQKIADLQNIGNSFDGVVATYILSAGREVRIVVDSDRINDQQALDLSKKIARKIEEECSYPGLIKLTVVRETQAVEMAR